MKSRDASLLAQIERDVLSTVAVADILRKCLVLGGRSGSQGLREWATHELKGYPEGVGLPEYRRIGAPILANATTGTAILTRYRLGAGALPEFVREEIDEIFEMRRGVGEIQAYIAGARDGSVNLSIPMAAEIARIIDSQSSNPRQHIDSIYWSVSASALEGVLDHVRTILTEFVAELHPTALDDVVPSASATDNAINIAVNGKRASILVSNVNAKSGGSAEATIAPVSNQSSWWTRTRVVGAGIAGFASILGLGLAIAQMASWL